MEEIKNNCVIVCNPENLLATTTTPFSTEIFKNFIDSEKIGKYRMYLYSEEKESQYFKDFIPLDETGLDNLISDHPDYLKCLYYVKNDKKMENHLKEKLENSFYDKIKVINISANHKISSEVPEWIKNNHDTSKDGNENVRYRDREENIYEINKEVLFYAEETEIEEIKMIVNIQKPFFVIGERGSGKTFMIQNAVKAFLKSQGKDNEPKKDNNQNFVPVACGTLRPDRAQSDLFGHTADAFTGADKGTKRKEQNRGYVGKANGGCLYLDEVQDLHKDIQRMLLKGIEEHEFYQLGSNEPYKSDFLLVCSSNKPLSKIRKYMYEDFYDRISVFQIKIPSIEERKKKDPDFIKKCLPGVWKNYKTNCKSKNFFEYDTLDDHNSGPKTIKDKMIKALNDSTLRGNFRDIEKLLAYIELYALNDYITVGKVEEDEKKINENIDNAITKWKNFIEERNSRLSYSIPPTLTDDFIKKQNWKSLNKMFKSWIAEQAVRIYGSVYAAAKKLEVDKNSIRNNLISEQVKNG